jgi:putative endonuclease
VPPDHRKVTGQHGESLARRHLEQQGYTILNVNWHCPAGELDIIAQRNEQLVIVEVRTRHAETTEDPFASLNPVKLARITAAAHHYLETHQLVDIAWRIDIVAIAIPKSNIPILEHIEDALDW